ncbi:P-loop containing nucleoside triphosphate hydrolase protein [Leucosporidium creatinivorum]|uniref:p-loop containing nucleoside triphosphate hydrolase protein n=1 Tax=Leucosporidium creatinivorum TaxID=106004 RepID=A0A1Y2G1K3_9BASI|nr:P-loop containing nucleoside triphosphate hydrolase protein [Leucosporidium creatinivorum]
MNKDPLNDNLTSLLAKSSDHYVSGLFSDYVDPEAAVEGPRTRVRKGAFRTVGQRHKEQLTLLMGQLNATQPHFIRCIVPNAQKSPSHIDVPLVLTQLRCNGVLEGIRIARIGYPNRLPFAEFRRRFGILAPSLPPKSTFIEGNEACSTILTALDLDPQCYRLGLTKVFFKAGILAELEGRRDDRLADIVTRLQATCRKFVGRRKATRILHRAAAVEMIQRNARIYIALRRQPWWALFQTVRPHLAAARSDGELRRKEEELAAANKRMAEEAAERERLMKEQAESEARRRQVEEQLATELLKLEEKDAKVEQGRKRVLELEEQLAGAQADVETADRHIDQLIALRKATDEQIAHLTLSDEHQRHLITTLQAEQIAWKAKEVELASQTSVKTAEWERIVSERDQGIANVDELKRKLSEEGQDRRREERRLADEITSLTAQLASASKQSTDSRQQLKSLETEKHRAIDESTGFKRQKQELEALVESKGAELARLSSGGCLVESRTAVR